MLQGGRLINQATTDSSGNYSITAAASTYNVQAGALGYETPTKTGVVVGVSSVPENFALNATTQSGYKTTLGDNLFSPKPAGHQRLNSMCLRRGCFLRYTTLSGKLIRTLYEGSAAAGDMQKDWDGRDDGGRYVVPSVYFLHYVYPGGKK